MSETDRPVRLYRQFRLVALGNAKALCDEHYKIFKPEHPDICLSKLAERVGIQCDICLELAKNTEGTPT